MSRQTVAEWFRRFETLNDIWPDRKVGFSDGGRELMVGASYPDDDGNYWFDMDEDVESPTNGMVAGPGRMIPTVDDPYAGLRKRK